LVNHEEEKLDLENLQQVQRMMTTKERAKSQQPELAEPKYKSENIGRKSRRKKQHKTNKYQQISENKSRSRSEVKKSPHYSEAKNISLNNIKKEEIKKELEMFNSEKDISKILSKIAILEYRFLVIEELARHTEIIENGILNEQQRLRMDEIQDDQESHTASLNQSFNHPFSKTNSEVGNSLDKAKEDEKNVDQTSAIKVHSKNIQSILSDELSKMKNEIGEKAPKKSKSKKFKK
jgi:hypothetical protein